MFAAALEEVQRRAGVLAHRARRIGARPGRIRDAGEVQHCRAPADQLTRRRVAGVELDGLEAPGGGALGAAGACERQHVVTPLAQQGRRAPAEEPGGSGDEQSHGRRYDATE